MGGPRGVRGGRSEVSMIKILFVYMYEILTRIKKCNFKKNDFVERKC